MRHARVMGFARSAALLGLGVTLALAYADSKPQLSVLPGENWYVWLAGIAAFFGAYFTAGNGKGIRGTQGAKRRRNFGLSETRGQPGRISRLLLLSLSRACSVLDLGCLATPTSVCV
jgi:hypothetical protein